jgi:hypothetical protein
MVVLSAEPTYARVNIGPPMAGCRRSVRIKEIVSRSGVWCKVRFYTEWAPNGEIPAGEHWESGTVHVSTLSNVWQDDGVNQ